MRKHLVYYALIALFGLPLVAVALLAVFAGASGSALIDLVRMGWIGFVLARLLLLFLIVLAVRRLWRTFPRLAASITALTILASGAFTVVKSSSPSGIYGFVGEIEPMNDAPDLAPDLYHKDHFWRLSAGKVDDCFGLICQHYGRYEKRGDGWVVIHELKEPYVWKLNFSILGFRLISDNGATAFYPRRIIAFPRPYWMPDWLQ